MPRVPTAVPAEALRPVVGPALRRHLVLILLVALVTSGASAAFAFRHTATYSSSTTVFLRPLQGNALSSQSIKSSQQVTTAMTTEAALVDSVAVLDLVNKQLDTHLSTGSGQISAEVPPNTQTVEVTFAADTRRRAQAGADAVANALLKTRSARAVSSRDAQLRNLGDQADSAATNLKTASEAAEAAEAAAKVIPSTVSTQQVQLYAAELSDLEASINRTKAQGSNPGNVIRPAALPSSPSSLSPWLLIAASGLMGLALGAALAIWRERTDDRLESDEATTAAGLPILTTAHNLSTGDYDAVHDDAVIEAFRTARAAIIAAAPPSKAISIAASDGYDDAGFVGLHLGQSLARADYKVAVICTSPESAVEESLHIDAKRGLHDLLISTDEVAPTLTQIGNLTILASGQTEARDPDLLASPRFSRIIRQLKQENDYVLVVASPVAAPGGLAVSLATDCLVLTGTKGNTTQTQITRDTGQAQGLGVPVLGVIVIDHGRRRGDHGRAKHREAGASALVASAAHDAPHTLPAEEFASIGEPGHR